MIEETQRVFPPIFKKILEFMKQKTSYDNIHEMAKE